MGQNLTSKLFCKKCQHLVDRMHILVYSKNNCVDRNGVSISWVYNLQFHYIAVFLSLEVIWCTLYKDISF